MHSYISGRNQVRQMWYTFLKQLILILWMKRRSWDRLIFNMRITILVRRHLYIETAPRFLYYLIEPISPSMLINTSRPRQKRCHFANDIFKCIFLKENVWIAIRFSLEFVPKINYIPALVQIMVWRRSGDKPVSELLMVSLLTHTCVTRPQWVSNDSLCLNRYWWIAEIAKRIILNDTWPRV